VNNPRRPVNGRAVALFVLASAAGLFVAIFLDRPVYRLFESVAVRETDLTRMFRVMGFLPVWLLAGSAVALVERAWRRGALIAGSATLAGLAGEVLKLLIRRERPGLHEGVSWFRPWSAGAWSTSGLATPSSHAIVAFGAAWILCRLYPGATPVWLFLATGCAVTRVIAGAHFVSDVVLSAVAAYAVVWLIWRSRWGGGARR
jgi:membrane-associated phospholipid phosphatase